MAFVGASLPTVRVPRRAAAALVCAASPSPSRLPPPPQPSTNVSRRSALAAAAAAIAAAATTALAFPRPAAADRTGKYSTKLTAARRYKPRITAAVAALAAVGPVLAPTSSANDGAWRDTVRTYVEGADGGLSAAKLFGSTYFSEGNRVSEREKELAEEVGAVEAAVGRLGAAAKSGSQSAAWAAWRAAAGGFNNYLTVAKLDEVPRIELGDE